MSNQYTIKVINQSGSQQHYALFNKAPKVTGLVQGQIWSNVFAIANTPKDQQGSFSIYKQYYAVVATSLGSPSMGIQVNVGGEKPVKLGSVKDDGTLVPGTTLGLFVADDAPQFSDKVLPDSSFNNCFEIQTADDFTVAQAKQGNYLIGLGGSQTGASQDGPSATFIPEPNVQYQIEPANTYYLTVGNYTKGALIDVTKTGKTTLEIAFAKLPSPNVVIVHNANGNLVIQS
ncbi:hypothetical protein CSPX01_13586 [Colletotrichum filicis]|nr:hypothetical protein CSPX01_13586 [Colletotrichum filicis]